MSSNNDLDGEGIEVDYDDDGSGVNADIIYEVPRITGGSRRSRRSKDSGSNESRGSRSGGSSGSRGSRFSSLFKKRVGGLVVVVMRDSRG